MRATRDDPDGLTATERRLVSHLQASGRRVVSYAELAHEVLGYLVADESSDFVVRRHVANVRAKLNGGQIVTVKGRGYRWASERVRRQA